MYPVNSHAELNTDISPLLSNTPNQTLKPNKATPAELFSEIKAQEANTLEFGMLCAAKEAVGHNFSTDSVTDCCKYIMKIIKHPAFVKLATNILGEEATQALIPRLDLASKHLLIFQAMTTEMQACKPDLADNILKMCLQDTNNICYVPGGWRGNNGQLVVVKAQFHGALSVDLRVINRSQGSHTHNLVEKAPLMNDLCSAAFRVNLEGPEGKQLFAEWSTLLFPIREYARNELVLTDLDFYGRLLCYGTQVEDKDSKGRASKNRFFGASPIGAIISMFADVFHTTGASIDDHRKCSLVIKLFSLMQEFSVYKPSTLNQRLFKEALDRMLVRSAKLGPESCNTQLIEALCTDMKNHLHFEHQLHVQSLVSGTIMPCDDLKCDLKLDLRNSNKFNVSSRETTSLFSFKFPESPENLIVQLKDFQASSCAREPRGYIELRSFLRQVPCTSNQKFWQELSSENALKLLDQLKNSITNIQDKLGRQTRQLEAEVSLLALDIAAICALKIPSLKFDDVYTVKLNVLTGHDAAFSDPDAVRTLERIKKNFAQRSEGKIALFDAKINMNSSVEVRYLLDHIITASELERFLQANPKESQTSVINKYLVEGKHFEHSLMPQEAFTTPFLNLLYLENAFVGTSVSSPQTHRNAYLTKGCLGSLPEWSATFKAENRTLPSEFFQARALYNDRVQDDRQNLLYSLKSEREDDLAWLKVGVVYDSYKSAQSGEKELEPNIHRELCTLEAARELRSLNTLDWLLRPHQFEHLDNPLVRDCLETLLFGPESVLHAVRYFPDQLLNALLCFKTFYQAKASLDTVAVLQWCSSVVVRFRYHFELENSKKGSLEALETGSFLREFLALHTNKLSCDSLACLHRAIAFSHFAVTIKNIEEYFSDLVRAAYHGIDLTEPIWPILLSLKEIVRAESICKNENLLTGLANEILQTNDTFIWSQDLTNTHCVTGQSKSQTICLNLYTGESSNSTGIIIDLLPQLLQNKAFSHLAQGMEKCPVAVKEHGYATSADGSLRFDLIKENGSYKIKHPYKEFCLSLNIGSSKIITRAGMLEEGYIDQRKECAPLCSHTELILKLLLGHDNVHTWRVDTAVFYSGGGQFERLLIDAKDPNRAVLQNEFSYVLMHLSDGVWQKQDRHIVFLAKTGQADIDSMLQRAVPDQPLKSNYMGDSAIPGCGFMYEKGVATNIIIPSLHISFTRCPDRLIWKYDQDIDYMLMTQKTVEALDGYIHGIVLQHVRDPLKKRVLLTPFAWQEKANQPVIKKCELLADHPFVCDIVQDEIVCDTATHLYLSIIFRNMRNFVLAQKYLQLSCHLFEDSELEQKLIMQIERLIIFTVPALAFDIHLLIRAQEHSERFVEPTFKKQKYSEEIKKMLSTAVERYLISESHYREGVSGIPDVFRVPEWILNRFRSQCGVNKSRWLTSGRLNDIQNKTHHTGSNYSLDKKDKHSWFTELVSATRNATHDPSRVASSNSLQRLEANELAADFLCLAKYAVTGTRFEKGLVQSYILRYLSQNNLKNSYRGIESVLLEMLLIILNNPQKFTEAVALQDTPACVEAVLTILKNDIAEKQLQKEKILKTPCRLFDHIKNPEKLMPAPIKKPPLLAAQKSFPWKVSTVKFTQWPTEDLYKANFTEQKHMPYAKTSWPIAKWKSENKLEMGLIDGLNQAFDRLRNTERSLHVPHDVMSLDLAEREAALVQQIADKGAEISRLMNQAHEASLAEFLALRASQEIGELKLEHAIQALLLRSHLPLVTQNPTLSETQLTQIYECTIEHQVLCIELNQIEEIRKVKGDSYLLSEVLFRKRLYDPGLFPEILAYAAATGKDPTAAQTNILVKLFTALESAIDQKKVEHLLLEFAAGGGKTLLLIPILCMFLISRGKLPLVSNTSDLYYQSLETLPPTLKAAYNLQVELIDRDVEHQWSEEELTALKTKLERWHKYQGRAILMKESSWHSLNTAGKIACYQKYMKNDNNAARCSALIVDILAYFKEHGVRLEDECQESSDPHEETIRSFEVGQAVPMQHHDIYYQAYQIANNLLTPGTVAGPEVTKAVRDACIKFFVSYKPFEGLTWLEGYLRSEPNAARPQPLIELERANSDKADLCILAKACIHLHLPHTESLTLGKEFGASIHEGDMTAAPRHDGRPSSAHFTDTMLVSALTTQKALEVGIPIDHLLIVAKGLKNEHDCALFKNERITFIEERLREVTGNALFRMKEYSESELASYIENFVKNPWLVERYLTRHALAQIRFHGSFAKSTPAEMALGFNISIQMSAVVGLKEIYSVLLSQNEELLDTEFVAEVLAVLMERNTQGLIMQDRSTPKAFFKEMAQESPLDFQYLGAFFDRGLFANFSAEALLQGAIDVASQEGLARHGITWDNDKTIRVLSNPIAEKKASTIAAFPLRQTTGRDYPELDYKAHCAFLLGKKVTLSGIVQTSMRARKLLIPNAQKIFWCVMKDLWASIAPGFDRFDVEKALRWALQNTTEEFSSKLLVSALQGIDAELHGAAWQLVHDDDRRAKDMLSVLCPKPQMRPWDIYVKEHKFEQTAQALQSYAAHVQETLGLDDYDLSDGVKDRIQQLIARTALFLDGYYTSGQESIHQIGFQNQEREQKLNSQLQVRSNVNIGVDKKTAAETYGPDDRLDDLDSMNKGFQRFSIWGIDSEKLPEFYLPNQKRLTPRNDWPWIIKPLSHVLVLQQTDKSWKYYALTEAGMRFYVNNITNMHRVNYPETRAFVAAIGKSVLNVTRFTMSLSECDEQINTARFMQMVSLLNLMVGRAFDAHALIATLKDLKWTRQDYRTFCHYIRAITPPDEDFAPEKYERELFDT